MNVHKVLLKIAYWLVALSILILIGLTFYARRVITQQSQPVAVENTVEEETTSIKFSGMTLTRDDGKSKKEATEIKETSKKDEVEQPVQNQTDKN